MDPSALIPVADAIPAAPWFFRVLLDATFAVHLLFMNAMLGFCLLGLVRSLSPAPGLGQQAGLIPGFTALAVNIGVAPLLFLQVLYGQFLYVSSTLMGVYWFAIVLAVMAAYGLAYRQKYALHADHSRRGTFVFALMSLLLLGVTLAQTHNAVLLVRPELWTGYFDHPDGTLLAWSDPTFLPRWLHFVSASVAVGGLGLAMLGHRRDRHRDPHGAGLVSEGLAWFSWATLTQMLLGVWWLVSLPRPIMLDFMGGDVLATVLLLGGISAALLTLVMGFTRRLMPAAAGLVVTVGLMVGLRGVLRGLYLAPHFDAEALPYIAEPSTVIMFLGCVVVSLAVVVWAARHPKTDARKA